MDRKTEISDHFIHVGGGTTMAIAWIGLIPGVIPFLALAVLLTVVVVLPLVALGLAAGIVAAPPYAVWRFISRRRRQPHVAEPAPLPVPFSGVC